MLLISGEIFPTSVKKMPTSEKIFDTSAEIVASEEIFEHSGETLFTLGEIFAT